MKTTIELPDDLLVEAKAVAARRRTTLKVLFESALRREIAPATALNADDAEIFELGPLGILRLKKRGARMTPEAIRKLMDEVDDEELAEAIALRDGKRP